jgi:hypothetical protein
VAFLDLADASERERALAVLGGVSGVRAWASDAIPEELRARWPARSGDIVVVADPGLAIMPGSLLLSSYFSLRGLFGSARGAHGYPPDDPDMGGVFLAMGRGVPADLELGPVRTLDVAATVARLLAIDPPAQSEGKPITGIGD